MKIEIINKIKQIIYPTMNISLLMLMFSGLFNLKLLFYISCSILIAVFVTFIIIDRIKIYVVVSGGFDPVHIGHSRLFTEAKKLGTHLIVILNNDNWLKDKKGYTFMPQSERKELLLSHKAVNEVITTWHGRGDTDTSVCHIIDSLYKEKKINIFANGGDRKRKNTPEDKQCKILNIKTVYNIGGNKIQSSSELTNKFKSKKQFKK